MPADERTDEEKDLIDKIRSLVQTHRAVVSEDVRYEMVEIEPDREVDENIDIVAETDGGSDIPSDG